MNIGDYVRTKDYGFIRIKDCYIEDGNLCITDYNNNGYDFQIEEFKKYKSSPNIIDLIEVGDIITFKNDRDVYRVTCIPNKKYGCKVFYLEFNHLEIGYEDIEVSKKDMKESLNSIVTKEQFESMEYKVGDKENEENIK